MVIVAGTLTVDPESRTEFLRGRAHAIRAYRQEQGCIEYAMSADAVDPSLVRLFEIWSTNADLQGHLQGPRSAAAPDGGVPIRGRDLKIYVNAQVEAFGA